MQAQYIGSYHKYHICSPTFFFMVFTLVMDQKRLDSIGYKQLANGIMYFSIVMCLKLDLIVLYFLTALFLDF